MIGCRLGPIACPNDAHSQHAMVDRCICRAFLMNSCSMLAEHIQGHLSSTHTQWCLPWAAAVSEADRNYMREALELAKRGLGHTHPNPAVGCVLVKDGQVGGCWSPMSAALAGCSSCAVHVAGYLGTSCGTSQTHACCTCMWHICFHSRWWAEASTQRQACLMLRCTRCGEQATQPRAPPHTSPWSRVTIMGAHRPAAARWCRQGWPGWVEGGAGRGAYAWAFVQGW